MDNVVDVSGWVIGAIGLALAVYSEIRRRRLSDIVRSNNWFLYQKSNNSSGHFQLALKQYKEFHKENANIDIVETLSKGDAFSQDVLKDVIRLIQMNEDTFVEADFDRWVSEGKIDAAKVKLFKQLATLPKSRRQIAPDSADPRQP